MKFKLFLLSLIFVFLFFGRSFSKAEDAPGGPEIAGRIFSDIYVPTTKPFNNSLRQASTSFWLETHPSFEEAAVAHLVLFGNLIQTDTNVVSGRNTSELDIGIREAYVSYLNGALELKAGHHLISLGKADVIVPTDLFSAKDYSLFNPDSEVNRLASTSLWLGLSPFSGTLPLTFRLYWTPVFPRTKVIYPNNVFAGFSAVNINNENLPVWSLSNSETAFQVLYTGVGWDMSVLAFRGWNHFPELIESSRSGPVLSPIVSLIPSFNRIRALGGDFSLSTDDFVFRFETAFQWTDNNNGKNPIIKASHLDITTGVERPFFNDFRFQLQFVGRYFPKFTKPLDAYENLDAVNRTINRNIAKANSLLSNATVKARIGGTLRLSYDKDDFEAELFTLAYKDGDYLLRPKVGYELTQNLKLTIGADYYHGAHDEPLGVLDENNAVFFEGKYIF